VSRICLALGLGLLAATPASPQSYDLSWRTVDGGGGTFSTGGSFSLGATVGQPDAGALAGSPYGINGGFWAATLTPPVAESDLAVSKSDGQAGAVPGQAVTYTIVVTNAGPNDAVGAVVSDVPPAALGAVAWTCSATPGSTCSAAGSGSIDDTVTVLAGGTLTYLLSGSVDPAATGALANTASVAASGNDPDPANNAATDTDMLTPKADLAVSLTDSPDPVGQGHPVTYVATVSNAGPSLSSGSTLALTLPPEATFVSSVPGAPVCVLAGGVVTCAFGPLAPSAGATLTVTATVAAGALGTIDAGASVTGNEPDPVAGNDTATAATAVVIAVEGELVHGTRFLADLAALPGPAADEDRYRIAQKPRSSYEVVLDGASADLSAGSGPALERIGSDGFSVVQSSKPLGTGRSRSLRWENAGPAPVDDETVRVRSESCTTDCGPDDVYRLRAYETTCVVPRFNNSATQLTVLLLKNASDAPVSGHVFFWGGTGSLLDTVEFALVPQGVFLLNTSTRPALVGQSGSVTVTHDGRYGDLTGKTVAVESSTGFTFDTPLAPRP
jgi:uncharacterized repeat protein (TIGR01451 family)